MCSSVVHNAMRTVLCQPRSSVACGSETLPKYHPCSWPYLHLVDDLIARLLVRSHITNRSSSGRELAAPSAVLAQQGGGSEGAKGCHEKFGSECAIDTVVVVVPIIANFTEVFFGVLRLNCWEGAGSE